MSIPVQPCQFNRSSGAWQQEAIKAVEALLSSGDCNHAIKAQLLPGDGQFYAIYDHGCFNQMRTPNRCAKAGSSNLYLIAKRQASESKVSLKLTLRVEVTPVRALEIEGGEPAHGATQHRNLDGVVLHPTYKALPKFWSDVVPIVRNKTIEPVDASIDLRICVRRESPRQVVHAVSIPETVIPEDGGGSNMLAASDLTAIVVAESIKLILKDGWDFLKKHAADLFDSQEMIQLDIAGSPLTIENSGEHRITEVARTANISLSKAYVDELSGLNRHLEQLLSKRKILQSNVERATTIKDKTEGLAEIEFLTADIETDRGKIWDALRTSGAVSIAKA